MNVPGQNPYDLDFEDYARPEAPADKNVVVVDTPTDQDTDPGDDVVTQLFSQGEGNGGPATEPPSLLKPVLLAAGAIAALYFFT